MKRILVAYDGSAPARRALDMTIELVNATGASGLQATRGRSDNSERKR